MVRGDFNVIVVDWSSVSSLYYQYAASRVGATGIAVLKFIEWLNVNYETLHLVGYDLGAHVAGIAGKYSLRGKINRIIGLDPSRLYFNENASANRLSVGDAGLVEVFHSNGGLLGIFTPIGDIDYYINNGRNQPECTGKENNEAKRAKCLNFFFQRTLTNVHTFAQSSRFQDSLTAKTISLLFLAKISLQLQVDVAVILLKSC